jgi:hypothetical protein
MRAEGKVRNVPMDGLVGDWKLAKIESRSATFTREMNETRVLNLEYAKLNAPPAPAPVAGQPGAPAPGGRPAASIGGVVIPQGLPDATRIELEERLRRRAALATQ